ncbi:MAG: menaquinone biosynthesis protein [Deltaproteobacteria bacterium]|nr:menaquinone biosynthesis protein [Deltaproteobacteria bacterium]
MRGARAERPLRVGRIGFANCTPLFLALEEGDGGGPVEYVSGIPTELNRMLREGRVDLSPSSSAEYLVHPGLYGFLPDLCISSIGPVASVLLFSRVPLEALGGRTVGLSPASATSVMLLRVILERRLGLSPRYGDPSGEADAILWIGDQALAEAGSGAWPRVYDLGSLWYEWTGTPFVFALWIARRDAFQRDSEGLRAFYRRLVEARQRAYRSYPAYARRAPEAEWLGEEALLAYWQTISYDLTAWHLQGLRRFAEEAHSLGLIPSVPPLEPLAIEG